MLWIIGNVFAFNKTSTLAPLVSGFLPFPLHKESSLRTNENQLVSKHDNNINQTTNAKGANCLTDATKKMIPVFGKKFLDMISIFIVLNRNV